ncbi:MAG TPA: MlaD family protein [Vicinamibacteria bacterium]
MSQKTHPRAVGVFVLGAIALVLAAIVLLSSGNWFEPKSMFTVFFPGSVRGLNKGAAVTFRGVKIGEVKDVTAFLTGQDQPPIQIEVVIEIRTNVVEVPEGVARPFAGADPDSLARGLIERGVRARMMSQSMLTGQKYIDLDFLPKEPARLAGLRRNYPELPTTPTAMERLEDRAEEIFAKLADLPLDQVLDDLRKALQSLRDVLASPDLRGTLAGTHRASRALEPAIADARLAIGDARKLLQSLDVHVDGVGGDARRTLEETRAALETSRRALESLERTLTGADQVRVQSAETLEELSRAMKAIRNLVDYIQTHPEAVLQGKEQAKEKK